MSSGVFHWDTQRFCQHVQIENGPSCGQMYHVPSVWPLSTDDDKHDWLYPSCDGVSTPNFVSTVGGNGITNSLMTKHGPNYHESTCWVNHADWTLDTVMITAPSVGILRHVSLKWGFNHGHPDCSQFLLRSMLTRSGFSSKTISVPRSIECDQSALLILIFVSFGLVWLGRFELR